MNSKERFLAACGREPVDRPPVWLMRQAGRYLPEYRLVRANHDFAEICKTPELACQVSLQPWERYRMDAVIVFSDILFVPEAMGQKLSFKEDKKPKIAPILKPKKLVSEGSLTVDDLSDVDAGKAFDFVYETIKQIKKKLPDDIPVIGFSGAPWTLASYMTGDSLTEWIKKYPDKLKKLLSKLSKIVARYLHLQQESGADIIQIFDTWAGELSKEDFREFALPYLKEIIKKGRFGSPFILYSRKCSHILLELAETGADVISIDPNTSIEEAIKKVGKKVGIQGNLDPKLLLTSPGFVRQETSRLLSKTKGFNGFIANLGHGILPTSLPECVEAFVNTVQQK